MAVLDKMTIELTGDPSQFQAAMRAAEQAMRQGVSGIEGHLARFDRAVKGLVATGLSFLSIDFAAQMYQTGRAALAAAGDLGELAEQAGITTDQLQVMVAAGVQAGAKVEDITTSMARFSRSLADAATEGGKVGETFNKLGVATRTSAGGVRDTFDALVDTAEAISKIDSPAQRIQVAMELLGRGGAKLLPILSGGRARMEEFAAQARKLGLVLEADLIKQADDTADKFALMDLEAKNLTARIATALLPKIQELELWFKRLAVAIVEPVPQVQKLQKNLEELLLLQQRFSFFGIPSNQWMKDSIADAQARLNQEQWRLDNQGFVQAAPGDKGKMSPTKPDAVAKMISGLESDMIVAATRLKSGDLAADVMKQHQAALDAAKQANRDLTKAEGDRIENLVRTIARLKEVQEKQDKYSDALDAEDASMGRLVKTQREIEAAKRNLINATKEEVDDNNALIAALQQSEEAYRVELRMQQLLAEAKAKNIALGPEEIAQLRERASELGKQDQTMDRLRDGYEEARRAASDFANVIGTAFEDAVINGGKFRDVLAGIVQDIARIALRVAVTKPFENFLTGASGGGGGLLGGLFSGFGQAAGASVAGGGSGGGLMSLFSGAGTAISSGFGLSSLFGGGAAAAQGIGLAGSLGAPIGASAAGLSGGAGIAGLAPLFSNPVTGALAVAGLAFGASKLFGGKKPSVGPNGTAAVLMGDNGAYGAMTSGDNGFTGGQVIGIAQEAARAIQQLATKLGTTVTPNAVAGFQELQGKLAFGFNGEGYGNSTSADRAVSDYLKAAVERGALAGITEVPDELIAGAVSGKLEQAMAQLAGGKLAGAIDDYLRQAERFAQGMENIADRLKQESDALFLDSNLSPLKAGDMLAEAQRQYAAVIAAARGGDADALARAPQVGRALLDIGQDFYGRASSDYRNIFGGVSNDYQALGGVASDRAAGARGAIGDLSAAQAEALVATTVESVDALTAKVDRLISKIGLVLEKF